MPSFFSFFFWFSSKLDYLVVGKKRSNNCGILNREMLKLHIFFRLGFASFYVIKSSFSCAVLSQDVVILQCNRPHVSGRAFGEMKTGKHFSLTKRQHISTGGQESPGVAGGSFHRSVRWERGRRNPIKKYIYIESDWSNVRSVTFKGDVFFLFLYW